MSIKQLPWNWGATDKEWRADTYPCDKYVQGSQQAFIRAIGVQAPANILFRWVCQIKVAPYSYDTIDNWFRRSPRELTPGAESLEVGQTFLVGPIVEFEQDRHITVLYTPPRKRGCPLFSLTYEARPSGATSSRLICKAAMVSRTWRDRVRWYLLAWGDLIMMRKQFLVLRKLAEKSAREAAADPAGALDAPGCPREAVADVPDGAA